MDVTKYIKNHLVEINTILSSISFDNLDKLANEILSNNKMGKKLFFTGVGKNGHVASKAASTFNSIGMPVFYLNPVDALHGDMGLIDDDDMILAISKSGNTEELVLFLNNAKRRTNNIWLLHSNKKNDSMKYCNDEIFIEIKNEADHLNIIPTVSISVYTILMQSVACYIAEYKQLRVDNFVKNHPGGSLGKLK